MKNKMVILDNTRIALNNIKQYGISKKNRYFEKVFRRIEIQPTGLVDLIFNGITTKYVWRDNDKVELTEKQYNQKERNLSTYKCMCRDEKGEIYYSGQLEKGDTFIVKEEYMYVTTYQNDNYVFWKSDVSFDIYKKCKEIDEMFNED